MKKLFILLVITILILVTSCATFNSETKNARIDANKCYLAGKFTDFHHTITLENLVTHKRFKISFNKNKLTSVLEIPEGKYAIVTLYGQGNFQGRRGSYKIDIPYDLMKLIDIHPSEIIYIGEFYYNIGFLRNVGESGVNFNLQSAISEIENKYKVEGTFKYISINDL